MEALIVLTGVYLLSLVPVALAVEFLLKRFMPFQPVSPLRILGRSAIRGTTWAPAVIGAGHGGAILTTPVALLLSAKADVVLFGYGIPGAISTCIVFVTSFARWRAERNEEPA